MTPWTEYLFRWHVIAIHFPIAMLVAAAGFEVVSIFYRRGRAPVISYAMVCCGAAVAVVAAWLGWELAEVTRHPGMDETVRLHRWGGVATAATALMGVIAGLGALRVPASRKFRWPYRALVFIAAALVIFTSLWGGELIYGDGHFFPGTSQEQIDEDE
jgi:uncharacterized membrane protein